jgi:hypothetical protein
MKPLDLRSSPRVDEAEWIASRLRPFGSGVASIVPDGFPAYARILHPASGPYDKLFRWAEVAAKRGRTMHRLAQFDAINSPRVTGSAEDIYPPAPGRLPLNLTVALAEALARHTSTPDRCWFCLWEGCGWLHPGTGGRLVFRRIDAVEEPPEDEDWEELSPVFAEAAQGNSRVVLPYRDYLLFEGPLHSAAQFGWNLTAQHFVSESANLFWPADHAWCVASEIDLYCTLVTGSDALIEALLTDPRLEVWRVFAEDPVHKDSDEINR